MNKFVSRDCSTFVKPACRNLELLKTKPRDKMQPYRTKLAIAIAKSKSEELSEIEESLKMVTKLSETLQKEVLRLFRYFCS